MKTHASNEFTILVPTLPLGVGTCMDIPCASSILKCVILINKIGKDIPKGISHNMDANLIIDMDRKFLSDDGVAIHIAKSLYKAEVP